MPHSKRRKGYDKPKGRQRESKAGSKREWINRKKIPINEARVGALLNQMINKCKTEIYNHSVENQSQPKYSDSEYNSLIDFLKRPHSATIWDYPRVATLDRATQGLLNEILTTRQTYGLYEFLTGEGLGPEGMRQCGVWKDRYTRAKTTRRAITSGPANDDASSLSKPPLYPTMQTANQATAGSATAESGQGFGGRMLRQGGVQGLSHGGVQRAEHGGSKSDSVEEEGEWEEDEDYDSEMAVGTSENPFEIEEDEEGDGDHLMVEAQDPGEDADDEAENEVAHEAGDDYEQEEQGVVRPTLPRRLPEKRKSYCGGRISSRAPRKSRFA